MRRPRLKSVISERSLLCQANSFPEWRSPMPLLNPSEVEAVRITLIRKLGGGSEPCPCFGSSGCQCFAGVTRCSSSCAVEVPVVGSESSTETESPPAPEESAPVTIETPPPPPAVPSQEPTPPVPPAPAVTNGEYLRLLPQNRRPNRLESQRVYSIRLHVPSGSKAGCTYRGVPRRSGARPC